MSGFRKSFHVEANVNVATAASAGELRGRTIFQKMPRSEQPSIRAASSSSSGMVIMYWRSKKMLNAPPPKNAGAMSGGNELNQPMSLKSRKVGVSVTGPGGINVVRRTKKQRSRPDHRKRAKPK